ncbi:MAG: sugar ABC transporter ATP-binding protein, partial [Lachnospiraceae bacterium]|nr:sugar ABC transporter ATP-binding protein [Lachnospiraceae bacterium]
MSILLEMKGISKSFNGVPALQNVQLELKRGEVHALLGENGAGKSTLIKILGGIYTKDAGEIIIEGRQVSISGVKDARKNGISIIHQELMMLPQMTIYENVFLGEEIRKNGFIDKGEMIRKTREMMEFFSLDLDPTEKLGNLPIAQQQIIEIIRAISFGEQIIVMDEPTSSLSEKEVDFLFSAIRRLKKENVGIIYISHRMSELDEIADRVTVMRDGCYVSTDEVKSVTRDELITKMVGRTLGDYYVHTHTPSDEVVMRVKDYSDEEKRVKQASFELRRGEVLGFAGLVGAGRSELMGCIFGVTKKTSGELELEGKKTTINSVK